MEYAGNPTDRQHEEHLRSEVARLRGYQAREPRRFGRMGTWDEAVDRAEAALAASLEGKA